MTDCGDCGGCVVGGCICGGQDKSQRRTILPPQAIPTTQIQPSMQKEKNPYLNSYPYNSHHRQNYPTIHAIITTTTTTPTPIIYEIKQPQQTTLLKILVVAVRAVERVVNGIVVEVIYLSIFAQGYRWWW